VEHDLWLADARADGVDQLTEVGDELLERHRRSGDGAVEGLARAALVPVDDGELFFQIRVEVTEESRLAEPGSAVQMDERRVGDVLAADHHPLVDTAQSAVADLGDTFLHDPARGRAKW
jgi:hypothetical protein